MENTINSNGLEIEKEASVVNEENKKSNEKKNYNAIDLVKFIMAIFVVAKHASPLFNLLDSGSVFVKLFNFVTAYAVPFFFMASAFFLFRKMHKVGNGDLFSIESVVVLRRYFLKMIRLYVIWQLICLPFNVWQIILEESGFLNILFKYLRNIFFQSWWVSGPLWYILASIYVSGFLLLMLKLKQSKVRITIYCVIIYVFSIFFQFLRIHNGLGDGVIFTISKLLLGVFFHERIFKAFLYFIVSMWLFDYKIKFKFLIYTLFVGVVAICFLTNNWLITSLFETLSHMLFFCIVLILKLPNGKNYTILRELSVIMYFIHNIFVFIARIIFSSPLGWKNFIFSLAVTLIMATIILYTKKKKNHRFLDFLF